MLQRAADRSISVKANVPFEEAAQASVIVLLDGDLCFVLCEQHTPQGAVSQPRNSGL